jgi:hypothetical protein
MDHVPQRVAAIAQRSRHVEPRIIGNEHGRPRVVDHERELVSCQPVVEAVDHPPEGRHGEPALQMRAGVAGERADERPGGHAESVERPAEPRNAVAQLAIRQPACPFDDGGPIAVHPHGVLERPTQAA